jgi:lysophospholipase L1-like esterase
MFANVFCPGLHRLKFFWRLSAAICAISLVALQAFAQATPKAPQAQVRIVLVGDSTMAVQSGWGPGFCALLPPRVACINMARSGRSSLSYRMEGAWDRVMALLKQSNKEYKATYVLIQFGHNDQPGKPGRSTDVATEFPANLTRFVEEVRSTDAKPVLITPLERRVFKDGKLSNGLLLWADATRKAAAAEHVPLIDLNAKSFAAMQSMGPAEADSLAWLLLRLRSLPVKPLSTRSRSQRATRRERQSSCPMALTPVSNRSSTTPT